MNIGRHSQRLGNTLMNSYHTRPGTKLFILKTKTSVQGAKGPESYNNRIRRCPNEDVFVTQPLESQVISNHLVLVPVSELSIESCLRSLACLHGGERAAVHLQAALVPAQHKPRDPLFHPL